MLFILESFESIFQINPADQTLGEIGTIDHVVIDHQR